MKSTEHSFLWKPSVSDLGRAASTGWLRALLAEPVLSAVLSASKILECSSPAYALSCWALLCHVSSVWSAHLLLSTKTVRDVETPNTCQQGLTPLQVARWYRAQCMEGAQCSTCTEFKINSRQQQMPHDISNPCCRSPIAACPICLSYASLCGFTLPRFEGAGIFQWHLWLPVPHFSFHGGPAGAAPGGGPAGLAGDDGGRWERGSALPGPRLNSRGSDWMAPKSNGTVSLSFTRVLCWAVGSFWVGFVEPNLQGFVSEVLLWGLRKAAAQYLVQWLGLCFLWCTLCLALVSKKFSVN